MMDEQEWRQSLSTGHDVAVTYPFGYSPIIRKVSRVTARYIFVARKGDGELKFDKKSGNESPYSRDCRRLVKPTDRARQEAANPKPSMYRD